MDEDALSQPKEALQRDAQEALVASGLIDDLDEPAALFPRPYRFAEGETICRHGDVADCLWIIVTGSIAVMDGDRTLFIRHRNEVVGEQHLMGNGYRRLYSLVARESVVEVIVITKSAIENHRQKDILWRNIARITSLKLRDASRKISSLGRQLADDTRILHAYTNEYALSRRMQSGGGQLTDYKVDRAIVWFSDIVDFSQHTINLVPTRTADIVQRFFNAQTVPIVSRGGHIDKFIGDGLMAFWVVPESEKINELCDCALQAAEEAVEAVGEICIGQKKLHLRVGLHVGPVLSGDFGSTTRHQFTLIGPEVNKTARLEGIHQVDIIDGEQGIGAIRLSEEFRQALSEDGRSRYARKSLAKAKNMGELVFFS